ncbi:MAG TPA: ribonuclease R, partial [Pseudoxanthomonas sp.]|nr:ribonuclease R [Pseudoxanthomonas sp.]
MAGAASVDAAAAPAPARPRLHDPFAAREANRYANPIPSREAILGVLEAAEGPQTAEELSRLLGLAQDEALDALGKRLGAMVRDGQLIQNRRGGFAPVEATDLIPGTVIANPEGFGFLRPEAGGGDDLVLPPAEMRKVMHGD